MGDVHAQAEVGNRLAVLYAPIIIQSVVEQVVTIIHRSQCRVDTAIQATQSVVESQKVRTASFIVLKVFKMSLIIHASSY